MSADYELDEMLKPICAANLAQFDEGKFGFEFDDAVTEVLEHISKYPYRYEGGNVKTEPRKITVELEFNPIAKVIQKRTETANGANVRDAVEVTGISVTAKVYPSKPRYRSNRVKLVTKLRAGKIVSAKFNPNNSEEPTQLGLDLDD